MRELVLDFQPRRPSLLALVALLASLLLGADAWLEDSASRRALDTAQAHLDEARQRTERVAREQRESRPENVLSAPESKALRLASDAIRVDWELLYRAIDDALGEDVALLAIRPNGKSVQISGEARNIGAALAFVDALRRKPLTQPTLVSHQVKQSDPQHPIVFEISATWHNAS